MDSFNMYMYDNVEGPVWINDALYFSEMGTTTHPPTSRILKIDADDNVSIAFPSIADTGSNGLAVDPTGKLVSANHGVGGIVSFTLPDGTPETTLTDMYMGQRLIAPNDLTIRSDGTIYFTDYCCAQAPTNPPQNSVTRVYMLPPGASTPTALFADPNDPNGITLSLDESVLYVGDNSGVQSYPVNSDGSIGTTPTTVDPADLQHDSTDGMAIDCAGDLYVVRPSTNDIVVVKFGGVPGSAGTTLGKISNIPNAHQLTNLAFGGTDHKTLYITAQGQSGTQGVFKLAMPVPGMPY